MLIVVVCAQQSTARWPPQRLQHLPPLHRSKQTQVHLKVGRYVLIFARILKKTRKKLEKTPKVQKKPPKKLEKLEKTPKKLEKTRKNS